MTYADHITRIDNATEHLFRCLEHFMANATDDDYRDMGITNPQLIRLIRMSWEAFQVTNGAVQSSGTMGVENRALQSGGELMNRG